MTDIVERLTDACRGHDGNDRVDWLKPRAELERETLLETANEIIRLRSCLRGMSALVSKAQSILAKHLPPDGPSAKETISDLLELLDGPEQREVQRRAASALNEAKDES